MAPATGESRSQALTKTLRDSHRDRQSDVTETQRHPAPFLARQVRCFIFRFPDHHGASLGGCGDVPKQFLTIS